MGTVLLRRYPVVKIRCSWVLHDWGVLCSALPNDLAFWLDLKWRFHPAKKHLDHFGRHTAYTFQHLIKCSCITIGRRPIGLFHSSLQVSVVVPQLSPHCLPPQVPVIWRTIQPPCGGPFRVLQRDEKTFKIKLNDRVETVSIGWLQLAILESSTLPTTLSSTLEPLTKPWRQVWHACSKNKKWKELHIF